MAGTVENTGTIFVSPGNATSDMLGGGLVDFGTASTLTIELDSDSSYDLLNINGNAMLDGSLEVSLLGNFRPSSTDVFSFLTSRNSNAPNAIPLGELFNGYFEHCQAVRLYPGCRS